MIPDSSLPSWSDQRANGGKSFDWTDLTRSCAGSLSSEVIRSKVEPHFSGSRIERTRRLRALTADWRTCKRFSSMNNSGGINYLEGMTLCLFVEKINGKLVN